MFTKLKDFVVKYFPKVKVALGLIAFVTLFLGLNVLNVFLFTAFYFALLFMIGKILEK